MKKLVFLSGALAVLLSAASCEKQVVETDFMQQASRMIPVTLTGTLPQTAEADTPGTRVTLDGVTPKWTAGDPVALFTTSGIRCPDPFTAQAGGAATTTFSGAKPDGETLAFAIFPASSAVSVSDGTYTLILPAEQDGTASSAIMAASLGPDEEEMSFRNLCNVVKLSIPSSLNVRKVELLRDDAVSGTFTVNGNTFAVTMPSSPADAPKRVTATRSSAFSGEVYLSVLPSSSKKIRLVLTNASGQSALIEKDLSTDYSAGHLKNLGAVPSTLSFTDIAKIGAATATQQYATATQVDRPQVTNGDFETWTFDGENLPDHWNSFQTADGTWASSGYSSKDRQVQRSTDRRPGSKGSYSCSIWSRKILTVVAQGNLTTGRLHAGSMSASNAGNYNYTDRNGYATRTVNNVTYRNPCFMAFTGRPDSLVYWVKFVPKNNANNADYEAWVSAYLHDDSDFRVTAANNSEPEGVRIGLAGKAFRTTNDKWVRHAVPFSYSKQTNPSYLLLNISTNKSPGGGATGDYLYIDDIEMIYPDACNVKTDRNGWATLYVDFNARVPSGTTAYYITKVAAGYARLVAIPAGSVIPKNTGVLIKGSADTQYTFDGSKNTPVSVSGNLLRGTLTSMARPSGTCRVLSPESTSSMAAFGDFTGSTLAANTAYLTQ